ncbi:sigma factor G inhibitor Gin [Thalassobacillus sp. CUG 92003]|uniref:sigma factor G inhibitor Gin n=1 Tax=Thalassobacillus sp. CUG 92003 TaxID=2736641 RepID=UPI0015E71CF5|nr:sigma factor G inhibitor Gin [Thalassobacillus sp. CUG 92003]
MKNRIDHCGVCHQEKEAGVYLYKLYICPECEKDIIQTAPEDERYQYYVKQLKDISSSVIHS